MKKLVIAAIAVGLMSTNAMALWFTGTVTEVSTGYSGTYVQVTVGSNNYKYIIDPASPAVKELVAVSLTAFTSGESVSAFTGSTDRKWKVIRLMK